ncbi:MAG: hypothetical protein ACXACG_14390 [Candidatus Thorarchaeota archaeon]|jgi:hypothetical protein
MPEESKLSKIGKWMSKISSIMKLRSYRIMTVLIALIYLGLYSIITGLLVLNVDNWGFSIMILDNWPNLIFRVRTPFNWEPIGLLTLGPVNVFLAVPNIIFGLFIGILVGANLSISTYTYRARTVCNLNPASSVLSAVPALLTGVACCGPTLLISLGIASATVTIAFVSILPFLFPLALIGLLLSLTWSGRKLSQPGTC